MKPTVISTVARTLAMDNSADSSRRFAISAHVSIKGERITAISAGVLDDGEGHKVVFSSQNGIENMRVEFNGMAGRKEAIEAIDAFIDSVADNIDKF